MAEARSRSDEPASARRDETWDEHYRDERDAAYLYRALAAVERNPRAVDLFEKLAVVEDRHCRALGGVVRAERTAAAARIERRGAPACSRGPRSTSAPRSCCR